METVLEKYNVIIKDGKIVKMGKAEKIKIPKNATVIEGSGKYLTPGLMDMHVHLWYKDDLELYLANGVTTIRDMFGNFSKLSMRSQIEKGEILGPHLYVASPIINGKTQTFDDKIVITNPEEAEKYVKEFKKLGYDFIKVYETLTRDVYDAIIETAKKENITVVGHVPSDVGIEIVLQSGQKSIEHSEISIVNIYQETYECKRCKKENRPGVFNPYTPEPVLQHSYATASSVAWTMYQKFVQSVPLYRQEKEWKQMGFPLSRATLSNWIIKTSEEWLIPVVEKLREELLKEKYLHADETPVQVLNEDGKKNTTKSYMWVFSTSENSKRGVRIFKYATGRSGENAKEFLKDFRGYLHTDAYSGYGKVEDIHHCLCWAHVRRYFTDALPKDMSSPEATLPATGVAYCNQLFDWERKFKNLTADERKKMRLEKEKPVLDSFWSWAENSMKKVLPKSKIGKALQYALNHKEKLQTYLEDGNCLISNNIAENSIKPFTVGRKN